MKQLCQQFERAGIKQLECGERSHVAFDNSNGELLAFSTWRKLNLEAKASRGQEYSLRPHTRVQHRGNMPTGSVPEHRTPVQGTQEHFAGKGTTGGGQSTQVNVSDRTSVRLDTKDLAGSSIGGGHVWC